MQNRMSNICDQLIDFLNGIVNWLWDTVELLIDILLEFVIRGIELLIAILHLAFQVVCFLRDLCIEAMQTFAGVFRGFVNIVSSIKCEDVEDFATACIVVLLWFGAIKIAVGFLEKRKKGLESPIPNSLCLLDSYQLSPPRGKLANSLKNASKKNTNGTRRGAASRISNPSLSSSSSESGDS